MSSIKSRRFVSIVLCCSLLFCLFLQTGCRRAAEEELSEVVFWHNYTGMQESVLQMLIDTYNISDGKRDGISVVPIYKPIEEITALLTEAYDEPENFDFPELTVISNELAYKAMCRNLIVSAENYLSQENLSGYYDHFLNEGRFTEKSDIFVFPVSKSLDITIKNDSLWRRFYSDVNVREKQWETWQGITELAEAYYQWSGGKAFFALESLYDYIFTFSYQQLPSIIQAGNKEIKINTNKEMLRGLWDFYYGGVVRGYLLQTNDIQAALAAGEIVGYAGEGHESGYFPQQYRNQTGGLSILNLLVSPYPSIQNARRVAPQRGLGISVFDHGEEINRSCYRFLHWFCSNDNAVLFSAANNEISSYGNTYSEPETKNYMQKLSMSDYMKYNMLNLSLEQAQEGATYAPTAFVGSESFCMELTKSLYDIAAAGRSTVLSRQKSGMDYHAAVASVDTENAFDEWYRSVVTLASKY